jgi:hypothetical protein
MTKPCGRFIEELKREVREPDVLYMEGEQDDSAERKLKRNIS